MAKTKTKKATVPTTIAAASVASGSSGGIGNRGLGRAIEAAMAEATKACFAKGITDDESIREAKLAARDKVKAG